MRAFEVVGEASDGRQALSLADAHLSFFEYAVRRMLRAHMTALTEKPRPTHDLAPEAFAEHAAVVLSALARAGADTPDDVAAAYDAGANRLSSQGFPMPGLTDEERTTLKVVDEALDALRYTPEPRRRHIVEAAIYTVLADREVRPAEAAMLRAVTAALDVPMPLILGTFPQG